MLDYYHILARAVSGLTTNNTQARQKLYEHARTFLNAQLRRQDPQISAPETIQQSVAFETAILRVEVESRSVPEKHSETFADNDIPDFASLLGEPNVPVPDSNNICLGVSPSPSHVILKKITK